MSKLMAYKILFEIKCLALHDFISNNKRMTIKEPTINVDYNKQ